MAAVSPAPPADQATDLMQKLSLDSNSKSDNVSGVTKKTSGGQYASANGGKVTPIPTYERSFTPLLQDHKDASMCYLPNGFPSSYYYGGYDGSVADWEDYSRYVNHDGIEVPPHQGVYGDMYHHGYGYAPYSPYPSPGSPVPTLGHSNQLYTSQHYQFPAAYFQPPLPTNAPFTASQNPSSKVNISTSTATDVTPTPIDTAKASSNGIAKGSTNNNNGVTKVKQSQHNTASNTGGAFGKSISSGGQPSSGYQDLRYGFDGMWSPISWYDGSVFADGQQRHTSTNNASSMSPHDANTTSIRNQNLRPLPQFMGMHSPRSAVPGMGNKMYPNNRLYGRNGNGFRGNQGFYSNLYDSSMNGRWVMPMDSKYMPRGQVNGFYGSSNGNLQELSELNKGPRGERFRNQKGVGPDFSLAEREQNLPTDVQDSAVPEKDRYNAADFPVTYADAKFFVIKSYSEDDIHKSIKYNVWASTPHGNKKLDVAYQESKEKINRCPVFLLFSVNTSGQFIGVAEMVGPVDFNKTLDFWQQDKWIGCFPVKWHIVKDVPNSMLKHITLENNENKPVTNSRDTQEVKLEQGLELLKLFKEHVSKTSIVDDFSFYEARQKVMQERRTRQPYLQRKVMDGKPVMLDEKDKDVANTKPGSQKLMEVVKILKKESAQGGLRVGELVLSETNCAAEAAGVAPKVTKSMAEKHAVTIDVDKGY
ncbi:YTH domain-containing protein ECT4-like isoform X1 [Zingiber officinale]|uniref:YTH domain-containing protein ECT4-like isoform X1 n=1 Tax=Zingiber officinale TaxID=94328 RepID=UPI001C4CC81D|nr:YTH domain-containing protein ECT4-like isoform X1 [Zingiber officinale]